jgi:hypothetical protein
MSDEFFISPIHTNTYLTASSTTDDRINVFEAQLQGWTIDQADVLGSSMNPCEQHAGYALLMICCAYFETLESVYQGQPSPPRKSKEYFRAGFTRVFGDVRTQAFAIKATQAEADQLVSELVDELYDEVRCGLYHRLTTKNRVSITKDGPTVAFEMDTSGSTLAYITLNPWKVRDEIALHFRRLLSDLRDTSNTALRTSFDSFFQRTRTAPGTVHSTTHTTPARSSF